MLLFPSLPENIKRQIVTKVNLLRDGRIISPDAVPDSLFAEQVSRRLSSELDFYYASLVYQTGVSTTAYRGHQFRGAEANTTRARNDKHVK